MLTKVILISWRRDVSSSSALEIAYFVLNNFAGDSIYESSNVWWSKTMTFHGQSLPTSCITWLSIDRIYSCHSLSLIASCIFIVAADHRWIHVHGIANSEFKHHISRSWRKNFPHTSSDLIFYTAWIGSSLFNKAFKINAIAI